MYKLWKNMNDSVKAQFVMLSLFAMMLPSQNSAQEKNLEPYNPVKRFNETPAWVDIANSASEEQKDTADSNKNKHANTNEKTVTAPTAFQENRDDAVSNMPQDTVKTIPAWSVELDSIQSSKPDTAHYNDFIDDVMVTRGYSTDMTNNLTQIAAEDLIIRGPKEYKKYDSATQLRQATLDDDATREKALEDLMTLHTRDLRYNGGKELFHNDISKGSSSKIIEAWSAKTLLNSHLPASIVLKQLGNAENISQLMEDTIQSMDILDADNLLGTMATHIGAKGTRDVLDKIVTGQGDDKLSNHYPEAWANTLVKKCILIPFGNILGNDVEDLKQNATFLDLYQAISLRYLIENRIALDIPEPEEKNEYTSKLFYMSNSFNFIRNTEEKTAISVGVTPFAEFDSRYTYNKDDYFIRNRQSNTNFTRRNTAFTGIKWRLANFDKEQKTGQESFFSLSGDAAIGYGTTNVHYDITPTEKQSAAERYEVPTAMFDDFHDMSADHLATRLSLRANVGPAYAEAKRTDYRTLNTDDLNLAEKYLAHKTSFVDYTAGANVLQMETGSGNFDVSVYGGFTDTNTNIRNKGEINQDGSSSQSQSNRYLLDNPQAVKEHFNAGTLPRVYASQNLYGLNIEYTSSDSRWGGFAGYSITTDNAKGGGGVKPLVKDWVSDISGLSDGHGQFNVGVTYNLSKKTEKRTETQHSYDREYGAINGENVHSSSKHTVSPTKVEESSETAPSSVKKRSLFRLNLKNIFGGKKNKQEAEPANSQVQPQPRPYNP